MAGVVENVLPTGHTLTGWIHTDHELPPSRVVMGLDGSEAKVASVSLMMVREDVEKVTGRPGAAAEIQLDSPMDLVRFALGEYRLHVEFEGGATESIAVAPAAMVAAKNVAESLLKATEDSNSNFQREHPQMPESESQQSYIQFPAGYRDPEGAVELGYDGWVFLAEGSNRLSRQYGPFRESADRLELVDRPLAGWVKVIKSRAELARRHGVHFKQLMLPEKNSCLPELFFDEIQPPTTLYRELVTEESIAGSVVDGYAKLNNIEDQKLLWTRNDNHMDCFGAYLACKALVESLGIAFPLALDGADFSEERFREGNISGEITGIPVWDRIRIPSPESIDSLREPIIVDDGAPAPGSGHSHIGSHRRWSNVAAPLPQTLMLYGSSTANLGESPVQMSWWLSRLFRSFEFRWDWNVEEERVAQAAPDFLICQSVERFLIRVPMC